MCGESESIVCRVSKIGENKSDGNRGDDEAVQCKCKQCDQMSHKLGLLPQHMKPKIA